MSENLILNKYKMENQEVHTRITPASAADAEALADLFIGHITAHPEYISHGEIQMGVGKVSVQDGSFITRPATDAREKWMKYILDMMNNDSIAAVWKAVDESYREIPCERSFSSTFA